MSRPKLDRGVVSSLTWGTCRRPTLRHNPHSLPLPPCRWSLLHRLSSRHRCRHRQRNRKRTDTCRAIIPLDVSFCFSCVSTATTTSGRCIHAMSTKFKTAGAQNCLQRPCVAGLAGDLGSDSAADCSQYTWQPGRRVGPLAYSRLQATFQLACRHGAGMCHPRPRCDNVVSLRPGAIRQAKCQRQPSAALSHSIGEIPNHSLPMTHDP